jgi:hypothetical protein
MHKKQALEIVKIMHERKEKYEIINRDIYKLMGDFPSYLQFADCDFESAVVKLLDIILGDESASYFLYECSSMPDGGFIIEKNNSKWPIKTFEDLEKYVMRNEK